MTRAHAKHGSVARARGAGQASRAAPQSRVCIPWRQLSRAHRPCGASGGRRARAPARHRGQEPVRTHPERGSVQAGGRRRQRGASFQRCAMLLVLAPAWLGAAFTKNVENASIAELRRLTEMHLRPDDLSTFERVTGGALSALLEHPAWQKTNRRTMQAIMGIRKVVAHELNAHGLHVLRAILTERIADHLRRSRGVAAHPLYEQFMRDGILIFRDVQNFSSTLDGLFSAGDRRVENVLRMVSGFRRLGADSFVDWSTHTHFATDPQFYMHVDTYHPTWKIFVFQRTTLEQGPLHYVYGSHRNNEGKLRWLFNRTRRLLTSRDTPTKTYDVTGPFQEATHGFHPSLRVLGFDPSLRMRGLPGETFHSFGFREPTPITSGDGMTLVVVDVSGLHYRGFAAPGATRVGSGFAGKGGGCLVCIPRKNPFRCATLPPDC